MFIWWLIQKVLEALQEVINRLGKKIHKFLQTGPALQVYWSCFLWSSFKEKTHEIKSLNSPSLWQRYSIRRPNTHVKGVAFHIYGNILLECPDNIPSIWHLKAQAPLCGDHKSPCYWVNYWQLTLLHPHKKNKYYISWSIRKLGV